MDNPIEAADLEADDLLSRELLEAIPVHTDRGNATADCTAPRDSRPNWKEVAAILNAEAPNATGARLLFRLGHLVCNLPLSGELSEWVVGREGDNLDLALPHPSMSRRHFVIRQEMGEFTISDAASRNGTYVNRRPLKRDQEPEVLSSGDVIYAGGHHFFFLDGNGHED